MGKPRYVRIDLVPKEHIELLTQALDVDAKKLRAVCDAYFIIWQPGAVMPFHDHGASEGRIMVVSGKMFEEHYSKKTGEPFGQRDIAGPGKVFNEGPQLIQRMGNAGGTVAVTLHVFLNGPMVMTEYAPKDMEELVRRAANPLR